MKISALILSLIGLTATTSSFALGEKANHMTRIVRCEPRDSADARIFFMQGQRDPKRGAIIETDDSGNPSAVEEINIDPGANTYHFQLIKESPIGASADNRDWNITVQGQDVKFGQKKYKCYFDNSGA